MLKYKIPQVFTLTLDFSVKDNANRNRQSNLLGLYVEMPLIFLIKDEGKLR